MPLDGTYEPGAWTFSADQVQRYEESGGAEGAELQGTPVIVLWTRGRRSGNVRKSPLMRIEHDGRYAVVASKGGDPKHPEWYLNVLADPNVSLQDGGEVHDYAARVVTGVEKAEWWKRAAEVWPDYDNYQSKTDREIPLVVLER
ncbi:MAG: nitroreductase family deazaflavin-dependent oxidoreductase [Acidimicrobiales bacterium]